MQLAPVVALSRNHRLELPLLVSARFEVAQLELGTEPP